MTFAPATSEVYRVYISSPAWARRKREYFAARGRVCRACLSTRRLHVHHVSYRRLGREPLFDLVCLCRPCHDEVHARQARFGGELRNVTHVFIGEMRDAAALAASGKRPRPRVSKRRVRFRGQLFPACRANRDTCGRRAPTRSGLCWEHDAAVSGPLNS